MTSRRTAAPAILLASAAILAGCSSAPPVVPASATQGPHVPTRLTFTGAVVGAAGAVDVRPPGSDADAGILAAGATQCAFAAGPGDPSHDAWSAQIAVHTAANQWQLTLTGPGFGNPKPGRYPLWGSSGSAPDGDLGVSVVSAKPIAPYLESAGAGSYGYYNPGAGDYATVAASLSSGTIHVTLTPDVPSNLKFAIDGTWSCV